MSIAETGGYRPSVATGPSASFEGRVSPVVTSPINAIGNARENPFSGTKELKVTAPQIFDREVPGKFAFTDTVPLEINAEPLLSPTQVLDTKEPISDFTEPEFDLTGLEIIAQAKNPTVQAKEQVQESVQTPIEEPNLSSLLELDTDILSVAEKPNFNDTETANTAVVIENVQSETPAASHKDELVLLEKYLETYGAQENIEISKTKEYSSPLKVEGGEIKFALEETAKPVKQNSNPDAGSYVEIKSDLAKAKDVIGLLIETGVDPQEAERQILADLHVKRKKTGLAQEIATMQKPVTRAEVSQDSLVDREVQAESAEETIQEVPGETYKKTDRNIIIEEDPVAQAKRKKIAVSAFAETVKEAKEKNDEINEGNIIVTGHDVAEKISSEQTDETTSEMVKYPVRRADGSYKPYRDDIDKIGEIKSVEEGLGDIEDALNNNKPLRVRGEVTTVEATKPEIIKVAGRPIETIIYPKQAT